MEIDDIVDYLEGRLFGGEVEIVHDGETIRVDMDNNDYDFFRYDLENKILVYDVGAYSGKINLWEIAEKIKDEYNPGSIKDLENKWDDILSEYFTFGDY